MGSRPEAEGVPQTKKIRGILDGMKKGSIKKMAVLMWFCVACTFGMITYLTSQSIEQTTRLTVNTEKNLPPAVVNPLKQQGLNVNTRQMAHVYEFAVLGFFMALAFYFTRYVNAGYLFLKASVSCLALSFIDQLHKIYVPGRHFDSRDMIFDAMGYLLAIIIVLLGNGLITLSKRKRRPGV